MSQFFVDTNAVPGSSIDTLSAQGGAPTPPAGTNFDFSGPSGGAILFAIAGPGLMKAAVQVDGVTITVNGSNQLTASAVQQTWTDIGSSQALVANNGYFCTSGASLSLSLPSVSNVGDTIEVALDGASAWVITQPNAATRIRFGSLQTTMGVTGTLTSTLQGDAIKLVCQSANGRWQVTSSIGNITVS